MSGEVPKNNVSEIVDRLYKREISVRELGSFPPSFIEKEVAPALNDYKNNQMLSQDIPRAWMATDFAVRGFFTKQNFTDLVSGGPNAETLAGNINKLAAGRPELVAAMDKNGDKQITASDFKIDNPELRERIIDNFERIQQEGRNHDSPEQALDAMRKEGGLFASLVKNADEAATERIYEDVNWGYQQAQRNLLNNVPAAQPIAP